MSEDDIGAGGGGTSFVVREDLVQALITLGVSRNAAVRVRKLFCQTLPPYLICYSLPLVTSTLN